MLSKVVELEGSLARMTKSFEVQIAAERRQRDLDVQSIIAQHNNQLSELKRLHKALAAKAAAAAKASGAATPPAQLAVEANITTTATAAGHVKPAPVATNKENSTSVRADVPPQVPMVVSSQKSQTHAQQQQHKQQQISTQSGANMNASISTGTSTSTSVKALLNPNISNRPASHSTTSGGSSSSSSSSSVTRLTTQKPAATERVQNLVRGRDSDRDRDRDRDSQSDSSRVAASAPATAPVLAATSGSVSTTVSGLPLKPPINASNNWQRSVVDQYSGTVADSESSHFRSSNLEPLGLVGNDEPLQSFWPPPSSLSSAPETTHGMEHGQVRPQSINTEHLYSSTSTSSSSSHYFAPLIPDVSDCDNNRGFDGRGRIRSSDIQTQGMQYYDPQEQEILQSRFTSAHDAPIESYQGEDMMNRYNVNMHADINNTIMIRDLSRYSNDSEFLPVVNTRTSTQSHSWADEQELDMNDAENR
jgi:hypothetical protein